jgi:hypothetical protein
LSFLAPTGKPEIKPPITRTTIILLRASITISKIRGIKDYHVLDHERLELLKKPLGVPLIRIENRAMEM